MLPPAPGSGRPAPARSGQQGFKRQDQCVHNPGRAGRLSGRRKGGFWHAPETDAGHRVNFRIAHPPAQGI